MFSEANLTDVLRSVASGLETPVIIILILMMAAAVVLVGSLIVEIFTERINLKVRLPKLVDDLKAGEEATEDVIQNSGLLKRQKEALLELTQHEELTDTMRESLAVRLIYEEQDRYDRIVKISDIITKLGPMFGLLGTLIPLGPGIIAMGQGNTLALSNSLLTAFDTTIAGLIAAAAAFVVSAIRKSWYSNYMSILEAGGECVLEAVKTDGKERVLEAVTVND